MRFFLMMLIILISGIAHAQCRPAEVLQSLRPGESFSMDNSNDTTTIRWDSKSVQPVTKGEYDPALSACLQAASMRTATKAQARADVKNTNLTQQQRLQALLILFDLDL